MMDYLRMRTYNLKNRSAGKRLHRFPLLPKTSAARLKPVVHAKPAISIREEIGSLPPEHVLVSSRDFDVLIAGTAQIQNTLHEIGRLREVTFRKACEGTGQAIDVDPFDSYYQHVILWNRDRREVAGAYRIALVDKVICERGIGGLYTNTLFDFEDEMFLKMRPALEVGRSFVRPEYQKTYQPLLLLWSGIGRFVAKNPRYRFLFGAVSISNDYHGLSRRLIVQCLREGYMHQELARLVHSRNPAPNWAMRTYSMIRDINDVSEVISDIEKDAKGIPILLKHYMKLGGQFLGFGQDPKFNNALDALVLVDLVRTDPKILDRYLGRGGNLP